MNPNEDYLTKPSVSTINMFVEYAFELYGTERSSSEISSYNIFPLQHSNETQKYIISIIKDCSPTLRNRADSSLIFLIFNTLVNSGYATKGKDGCTYHLTEQGYRRGLKLKHPIKYLVKFHWKSILPIFVAITILCIKLKYNQ